MNELLLTHLKQTVEDQYRQKYGAVSITFDELTPQEQDTVRLAFSISKGRNFITRYYGWAEYQDQQWSLQVKSI